MRTYLVTGGAGFIGSNYIHYMFKKYDNEIRIINVDKLTYYMFKKYDNEIRIINVDKLTYAGNLENLKDIEDRENYTFVKADICDADAINKIFEENEIDRVVHFAAESHVDRSIKNPDVFVKTNVLGTLVMLNAAKAAWELPDGTFKVVHFAAESHVDRSIKNPDVFVKTNVLGTLVMLNAAKAAWELPDGTFKEGKKFLHVSTDEVYGSLEEEGEYFYETTPYDPHSPYSASKASSDMLVKSYMDTYKFPANITNCSNNYGPYQFPEKLIPLIINNKKFLHVSTDEVYGSLEEEGEYFYETTPYDPHSPYSASKASSDMLVKSYMDTYKFPANITNCSNNYGPYQFPEKLIPLIINNALQGKSLPVYGDGKNVRDWLYVEDHAKGIDMVQEKGRLVETYNIGGHNEKQNIQIIHIILDTLQEMLPEGDPRKELVSEKLITYVEDRKGHDRRYAIAPDKIKEEVGWYPETMFEDGIRLTIKWFFENEEWMKNVTSGDYQKYYEDMYQDK